MTKTSKNTLIIIISIIVVGLLVWWGITKEKAPETKKPIKIGFISPLSGDAAAYGENECNSTKLAVEEINNTGGINGRLLQVIYEDGKCNGKDATTAAQKLINMDGVKVILGGACSAETLGAAPIAEENKVILLSAFSSSPDITDAGDYIFRSVVSDLACAEPLLPYFIQKKKLALITENTDYSQGIRQNLIEKLPQQEVEIVADELYAPGEKDFRSYLLKIKSENPEAIFVNPGTNPAGAGLIAKQMKELDIAGDIYGNFLLGSKEALEIATGTLEGAVYFDAPVLSPENPKAQTFLEKYKNKYNKEPVHNWDAGANYDRVYIIADALKICGENTDCIKDYLYQMPDFDGVIGKYHFDENGDSSGVICELFKIVEGEGVRLE